MLNVMGGGSRRVISWLGAVAASVMFLTPASANTPQPRGPLATTSCASASLRVTAAATVAGLGNNAILLRFTNSGRETCWIRGYARVVLYGAPRPKSPPTFARVARDTPAVYMGGLMRFSGHAVGLRAQPTASLAHGASAYELVGDGDNPLNGARTCPSTVGARVVVRSITPTGTTMIVRRIPAAAWQCFAPLVTPIVPYRVQRFEGATYHQRGTYFLD